MAAWLLRGQVAAQRQPRRHAARRACSRGSRAASSRLRSVPRWLSRAAGDGIDAPPQAFRRASSSAPRWPRFCSLLVVGQDFFPGIKAGEIDMHMRAPIGTRIEEAAKIAVLVDQQIRDLLPGQVTGTLDELRPADQRHQPGLIRHRHGRAPRIATLRSRSTTRTRLSRTIAQILRGGLTQRFPRHRIQLPAGRHHRARS